jgi:TRAP-type C4-dicarboxylate transport system permease small subunit
LRTPFNPAGAAGPFGLAASLCLVFMMLFTTVAVVMRQLFDAPVLGVIDVMELALVGTVFFAMPGVFLRDENVTVDVIDQMVSRRARTVLRLAGLAVTLVFLVLMIIQMFALFVDKWAFDEVTMTLGISRWIHWTPIILGFLLSIVATAWVAVYYLRQGPPSDPTLDGEQFE